jgi:hypothetical protein
LYEQVDNSLSSFPFCFAVGWVANLNHSEVLKTHRKATADICCVAMLEIFFLKNLVTYQMLNGFHLFNDCEKTKQYVG